MRTGEVELGTIDVTVTGPGCTVTVCVESVSPLSWIVKTDELKHRNEVRKDLLEAGTHPINGYQKRKQAHKP